MSLCSVQKALRRHQTRQAELAALDAEPHEGDENDREGPWSRLSPDELARWELAECMAALAADPSDELANYRLRHMVFIR